MSELDGARTDVLRPPASITSEYRLRRDAEAALQASEDKYRTLFNTIDEGFCIIEIVFDENGRPADYRFMEINAVFAEQSGLVGAEGKTALELIPTLEYTWIEMYGRVALTGEAVRFEEASAPMGRSFDVFASRVGGPGSPLVAIVFRDISALKRRELRSTLLEAISNDLATLSTAAEMMETVGARVGKALGLTGCIFADVDETCEWATINNGWTRVDVPSVKQIFRVRDYLSDAFVQAGRDGESFVVNDVTTDERTNAQNYAHLNIGAFATIPFHWNGRWSSYFSANSVEPRQWSEDEIELLTEISNRLFARVERAVAEEALRASEAQLARELNDTKQLQEVSGLLIEDDAGDALYQLIIDTAIAMTDAQFGSMQVVDAERNVLRLLAWRNFTPDAADHWRTLSLDHSSPRGAALRKGERVIVPDVHAPAAEIDADDLMWYDQCGIKAIVSTPLSTRAGRVVGTISTHWSTTHTPTERELRLVDIIARQAADFLERRRVESELQESSRRKDEFLATLAHELRNPLAPIRNGVELLRLTGTTEISPVVDIIERQVTQLVRLVDDLMEVSRITRGKIELRRELHDVRRTLHSAIETANPVIIAAETSLVVRLPEFPVYVYGDAVRLNQVFSNLLNNAAKYTEAGGQITLSLECVAEEVVVRVRDTGTGIPADMLPRVFDLFTQVDRTLGRAQGGLGIGLALVRTLVEQHGGSIEARSDGPALGSEFVVRLPAVASEQALQDMPDAPMSTVNVVKRLATLMTGRAVIVADDNRDAADTMAKLLSEVGADVAVAYSGRDAIAAARTRGASLIFLDLGMPDTDGYMVAQRLRADPQFANVKLVALSGWGQESDVQLARESGFDYHLVKPADASRLLDMMLSLQR